MNDDERTKEALFRHAILGEVLSRSLRKGQLRPLLTEMSGKTFEDYRGCSRQMAFKTLLPCQNAKRNGWAHGGADNLCCHNGLPVETQFIAACP